MNALRRFWSCRWPGLRLLVAVSIALLLLFNRSSHLARLRLEALPDEDVAAEVRALTAQGRLGEALSLADAAIAQGDTTDGLARARADVAELQMSWIRAAKDLGWGALTGRSDTLEGLIGAVSADFFVIGDLRDLIIQGTAAASRDDTDGVIAALSLFGLTTTLAPQIDWAPSILKAARKAGSLTDSFAGQLRRWIVDLDSTKVVRVCEDLGSISKAAPPGTILRTLRGVENAEDLAAVARFVDTQGQKATRVLHAAGVDAVATVKLIDGAGTPGVKAAEVAARKGQHGISFLRSPAARSLLKPHPIIGLLKGVWKGTLPDMLDRAVERLAPSGWWALPVLSLWILLECWLIWTRLTRPIPRLLGPISA